MPRYKDPDDVLKTMQPILDRCAKRNNGIDGIAFLSRFDIKARSQVEGYGGTFDATAAAALLANFREAHKDTFKDESNLNYVSFLSTTEDGEITAWSVVVLYEIYSLVFTGKLKNVSRYSVHRGTVEEYVKELELLIEEYEKRIVIETTSES
ncbi:MAG: hypothetical protein F6K47_23335 [Symploca sp. SIO2E6]|nr:hypothetical protein [Symploca sp. SIO2E6]